jgi:hypothetical protein
MDINCQKYIVNFIINLCQNIIKTNNIDEVDDYLEQNPVLQTILQKSKLISLQDVFKAIPKSNESPICYQLKRVVREGRVREGRVREGRVREGRVREGRVREGRVREGGFHKVVLI